MSMDMKTSLEALQWLSSKEFDRKRQSECFPLGKTICKAVSVSSALPVGEGVPSQSNIFWLEHFGAPAEDLEARHAKWNAREKPSHVIRAVLYSGLISRTASSLIEFAYITGRVRLDRYRMIHTSFISSDRRHGASQKLLRRDGQRVYPHKQHAIVQPHRPSLEREVIG